MYLYDENVNGIYYATSYIIVQSVCKTGRMVIAHEAPLTQGFASEVASAIQVKITIIQL